MIFKDYELDTTNCPRLIKCWDDNEAQAQERLLLGMWTDKKDGETRFFTIDEDGDSEDFKHIKELKPRSLVDHTVHNGDILVDSEGRERLVFVAFPKVLLISVIDDFKEADDPFTHEELVEDGWSIKGQANESKIVELTIQDISDGKGQGIPAEFIRIKE